MLDKAKKLYYNLKNQIIKNSSTYVDIVFNKNKFCDWKE